MDQLASVLKELDQKIYYYPNPGNAGDSLIACATYQFFDRHNINYETVLDPEFDSTGKTIVYAGGGNFGGSNSRVARFIIKYKDFAKNIVILPHTIFGAEDLLSTLGNNCYLFCRENVSYEHVKTHATDANVYLHHDMVFTSEIRKLMNPTKKAILTHYFIKEITKRLANKKDDFGLGLNGFMTYSAFSIKQKLGFYNDTHNILYGFRTDVERTDIKLPEGNLDLSAILELSSCEPNLSQTSCSAFLSEIDKYDEVHTNRLHMAIAAAMLGKRVKLFSNNYYKIKAIYDYSLKNIYTNIEWC